MAARGRRRLRAGGSRAATNAATVPQRAAPRMPRRMDHLEHFVEPGEARAVRLA